MNAIEIRTATMANLEIILKISIHLFTVTFNLHTILSKYHVFLS